MKRPPTNKLLIGAALVVGLFLGYLLWGRSPSPATVQAAIDRATRAEELAAQNTRVAALWIGTAHQWRTTSDSLFRERAKPARIVYVKAAAAESSLVAGDTAKAVVGLLEAVDACRVALTLDSLALNACGLAGAAKDSAISVLGVTVDSLRAAGRGSVGVLKRLKPRVWAVGPVWSPAGWGAQIERDLGPVRLSGSGLIQAEPEVRVGVLLRF